MLEHFCDLCSKQTSPFPQVYNGTMIGDGPECVHYYPDVFLLSLTLFFGTFLISMTLKEFKSASFFPTKVSTLH